MSEGPESDVDYSVLNLKQNEHQMQMNRICIALIAGVVSGILRVEGLQSGSLMFVLWNLIGSAIMIASVGFSSARSYFPNGVMDILTSQLFSGLLTYILIWTFVYDIVHIF